MSCVCMREPFSLLDRGLPYVVRSPFTIFDNISRMMGLAAWRPFTNMTRIRSNSLGFWSPTTAFWSHFAGQYVIDQHLPTFKKWCSFQHSLPSIQHHPKGRSQKFPRFSGVSKLDEPCHNFPCLCLGSLQESTWHLWDLRKPHEPCRKGQGNMVNR